MMGLQSRTLNIGIYPNAQLRQKFVWALLCSSLPFCELALATQLEGPNKNLQTEQETTQTLTPEAQSVAERKAVPTEQLEQLKLNSDSEQEREKRCFFDYQNDDWIDNMRQSTHNRLCRSVLWVDKLFGDDHEFNDREFTGKVSLGFRQDEADGFDPRLRVRIKTKLPNVSNKLNAFIGRVEEDSYISNTEVDGDQVNAVGLRSANDDEDEWLVGLGYRNPNHRSNGLDYSVGAKLSSGLNPYARIIHRYLIPQGEDQSWRTTQTVFWQRDDGFGVSSSLDYTHILSDHDIFEWDTSAKFTEEEDQWEWISSTAWHHSFNRKQGISSRSYIRGEEKSDAAIPEFGVTFTYVQPFLKPWLLVETGVDFRWEKFDGNSEYKSAVRFGLQFEMILGDYYSRIQKDYRER